MENNNPKETLKNLIQEFLTKMDFMPAGLEIEEADFLTAKIEIPEAGLLIGQGGENLDALQYLVKIIISKKMGQEAPRFLVDINNYRANRLQTLKETALRVAEEVRREKKTKFLEAMSAFERRIVHLTLKDFEGVTAEGMGEEPNRKIVIRPI
jgi:spoIIIJ-associated protein